MHKQRRAIGADYFMVVTHVEKHMRMVMGRGSAAAHELVRADLYSADTLVVLEMWNCVTGHGKSRSALAVTAVLLEERSWS